MYRAAERSPSRLSAEAVTAFEAVIGLRPNSDLIIHLITLQDVYMTFHEQLDFRTWELKTITTGGLSFPGYMYGANIPRVTHIHQFVTSSWAIVFHESFSFAR